MIGIQGENGLEEVTKSPPDTSLDANSTNSVENRVVTAEFSNMKVLSNDRYFTTDQTVTDDTNVTLVTQNFTLSKACKILVTFYGCIKTSHYTTNLNLLIDGVIVKRGLTSSTDFTSVICTYAGNLAVGSHTIAVGISAQTTDVTGTLKSFETVGFGAICI